MITYHQALEAVGAVSALCTILGPMLPGKAGQKVKLIGMDLLAFFTKAEAVESAVDASKGDSKGASASSAAKEGGGK